VRRRACGRWRRQCSRQDCDTRTSGGSSVSRVLLASQLTSRTLRVSYAQVFVRADVAEALQHAEDFAALRQAGWAWGDAQVDGARRQLGHRSSGGHGGVECRTAGCSSFVSGCAACRQVGRRVDQSSACISRAVCVPWPRVAVPCQDRCTHACTKHKLWPIKR
jgi:hypothetical protein